jgi:hypothetical protein
MENRLELQLAELRAEASCMMIRHVRVRTRAAPTLRTDFHVPAHKRQPYESVK